MNSIRTNRMRGATGAAVRLVVAALVLWSASVSCSKTAGDGPPKPTAVQEGTYRTALTPHGRGIVRKPAPFDFVRGALETLPAYNNAEKSTLFQVDLRACDLSALDLGGRSADLFMADFDVSTRWPRRLPRDFDPSRILELGKNPGLGVRKLHDRGITGRGVGIAVIDQGLLVDHVEYADRLRLYEEIHCGDDSAQMHGPAVASIATGRTVGVAPEADLYFIALTFGQLGSKGFELDFAYLAQGIDRIRDINRGLPKNRKIRVLSISRGWEPGQKGFEAVNDAVARAQSEGIFVISMSLQTTSGRGWALGGLGRDSYDDPDALASVKPGHWWSDMFYSGSYPLLSKAGYLLVPMDSRTTAGPAGPEDYAFYRTGGASWTAPWIAGLYALACQAAPTVTPEIFWEEALETGDSLEFPPRPMRLTPKEIDERVAKIVNDQMAKFGAKFGIGPEREKAMAAIYNQTTGKRIDRISEDDFRAWGAEVTRDYLVRTLQPTDKPIVLKKVVNPSRLIEALAGRH